MKTVDKFVLKSYLGPMVMTFFIVMFVLLMQFMWRYIDELVGKGITTGAILELMMYAVITLIPMGLPLATLLAAIMTMGNLGENYELLALKSAGMSLQRIIAPLVVVVALVSVGSFFVVNNSVPYAFKRIYALLYDIRQQKQVLEFKDGIFFNGIDNMSIRVGHQEPRTKQLRDVLIYDNRAVNGNMTTTLADSGYIKLSDDKKFLLVSLYRGNTYEQTRNYQWYDKNILRSNGFARQEARIPLAGFDFERTQSGLFTSSQTKNIVELEHDIDSLNVRTGSAASRSYIPLLSSYYFPREPQLGVDSLHIDLSHKHQALLTDSIFFLSLEAKSRLFADARSAINTSRSFFTYDEDTNKESLALMYRYKVQWHKKISLPFSIVIFFLIGAPLGAIIRKGGLGMPVVVSVSFFIIYYIISITGEKMAHEGSISAMRGVWFSTLIILPIALFLTYKATNDSNLFNADLLRDRFHSLFGKIFRRRNKLQKDETKR